MKTAKKFWDTIPSAIKMTSAAVIGIFAIVSYLTLFQTDAEAAEVEKRIYKKLDLTRIEVNDQKIKDYEFKLLDPDLTKQEKEWIDRQIINLKEKNDCIRKEEC